MIGERDRVSLTEAEVINTGDLYRLSALYRKGRRHNLIYVASIELGEMIDPDPEIIIKPKRISSHPREFEGNQKSYHRAKIAFERGEVPKFHLH